MAAPLAAAPAHHRAADSPAMIHHPAGELTPTSEPEPAPGHPEACDTVAQAVLLSPGTWDRVRDAGPADPILLGESPHIRTLEDVTAWAQPHRPPGIRRALFQVFRI